MEAVAEPAAGFGLAVERSHGGRRWRVRGCDERAAYAISQSLGLPDIVGRVLAARGVLPETAGPFLAPSLRASLPDPSVLRDMDRAVARLLRAITEGEEVAVFGDYDVDGASAAALLVRFFAALGRALHVYIPDRLTEGYGPSAEALLGLKARGVSLVVTVDCGTAAFGALEAAAAAGLDVIVVDHHLAGPALPPAHAVVNPNRFDEPGGLGQLAAVGVAFLVLVALNRALRAEGWYGHGHAEPDLLAWLDLVALGTVCDVVPLTGLNRALVAQGLRVMARRCNAGIAALADVAGLAAPPGCYHAGFILGPRVNAGGRVGECGLGVRLLASDDAAECAALAARLDGYNRERQAIEAAVLEQALPHAEAAVAAGASVIVAAGAGWHPGVIGIVAARLRQRYDRPAVVVAFDNGVGKGSGRSIGGVKLGAAVIAAHQAGLLINGGGHDMAAGFTVAAERLAGLEAFLADHVRAQLGGALPLPSLAIDGALTPAGATEELVAMLERAGPFGTGNPRPRFVFPAVAVHQAAVVGERHVRCLLAAPGGGARLSAIAFRALDSELGAALLGVRGAPLHVAGELRLEHWQGRRRVQLAIEDAAPVVANA